jgi:hypothetical protein
MNAKISAGLGQFENQISREIVGCLPSYRLFGHGGFSQPVRDCYLHAAELGLPLVEGGPADAMRSM